MKKYKAVFFDLDHTLWDFDFNSGETISELFIENNMEELGIPGAEVFIAKYRDINHSMWDAYNQNLITKENLRAGRFKMTLQHFGIPDDISLAEKLSSEYLKRCPVKTGLFPGAIQILEYLSAKYSLHIITNGFKEVQYIKIKNSGLAPYFENIHISEEIGYKKPSAEIFNYAVQQSGSAHEYCVMIGDNMDTDILGAENVGIDPVLFNPNRAESVRKVKYEIFQLEELRTIL